MRARTLRGALRLQHGSRTIGLAVSVLATNCVPRMSFAVSEGLLQPARCVPASRMRLQLCSAPMLDGCAAGRLSQL